MENKELNLCEFLKGYEGEKVYTLVYGPAYFDTINSISKIIITFIDGGIVSLTSSGKVLENCGTTILFPSKELYEKYPLDPYSAWVEWKEKKEKKKRWRAVIDSYFYMVTAGGEVGCMKDTYTHYTNDLYELGNYFRTEEEAKGAVLAIRECFKKFHKK